MGRKTESFWSYAQKAMLWELSQGNLTPREIAVKLAKTEQEVLEKAAELGITFGSSPGAPATN